MRSERRPRLVGAVVLVSLAGAPSSATPRPAAPPTAARPAISPPPSTPAPRTELIDRIVAVVNDRPLLLSEVRALSAVRGISAEDALEAAIDELLMYAEVSRVALVEVTPEDERDGLQVLLREHPALQGVVPEPDLRRLLRRQIAILRYLELRFRPQVQVSDEAVRKEWERADAGGPALEDAQQEIRARLERRAIDERIEAWVKELRARADVRRIKEAP